MKKFRFQLLHEWIVQHFIPCRVADIGGGKGLLTYLLNQSGFHSTVIDPYPQPLPTQYKDLHKERHKISPPFSVPSIDSHFEKTMTQDFDLLVGLHAHGSNMKIIEVAAENNTDFLLMPCCVIDEPIRPRPNINWLDSLEEYAKKLGVTTERFALNFRGQNIGFYTRGSTICREIF